MVNSLISRWFINAMAASSLLLIELERIEQLADLALPGQQTAVQNSAWRALWPAPAALQSDLYAPSEGRRSAEVQADR